MDNNQFFSEDQKSDWLKLFLRALRQANYVGTRKLRPGLRTLIGVLFLIGGVFWFLPILGLWMLPVGLLLIALDVPVLRRPVKAWLLRLKQKLHH
ncbi:MAG: hypothetical protein HON14_16795 [Rhodospirillaceae bacterium]|jgi:hypothetical protein|nr:hypothetical protein [Rhodospirillaceae bacterium]MBT4940798.1 hypothetical protein [Rhodospirillaceae bacterium]MBT5941207.1 hypothetical protein [Rhodospirillaceae bacterium]MBT7268438.1 hypothetical protein [Rhodospirillaceae bacterium]